MDTPNASQLLGQAQMFTQFVVDLRAILDQRFTPEVAELLARIEAQAGATYVHLAHMNAAHDRSAVVAADDT